MLTGAVMTTRKKTLQDGPLSIDAPMHIVTGLDGGAYDPEEDCPICATLTAQRMPLNTVDENGEIVRALAASPPRWIEVTLEPSPITAGSIGLDSLTERVPEGCSAADALAYFCFTYPDLAKRHPPWELVLRRGRHALASDERLADGDRLSVRRRSLLDPA